VHRAVAYLGLIHDLALLKALRKIYSGLLARPAYHRGVQLVVTSLSRTKLWAGRTPTNHVAPPTRAILEVSKLCKHAARSRRYGAAFCEMLFVVGDEEDKSSDGVFSEGWRTEMWRRGSRAGTNHRENCAPDAEPFLLHRLPSIPHLKNACRRTLHC
jgi:hypothetical protein